MEPRALAETFSYVTFWDPESQAEVVVYAPEVEAAFAVGEYQPTEAEFAGIDRGLADARAGRFATDEEVAAVFARFRGA